MDAARGVVAVLSEALCLTSRSKKHMLPCLLLALIPSSLLLLGDGHASVYSLLLGFIARLHSLGREYPVTAQFYELLLRLKSDAGAITHVNAALVAAAYLGRLASTFAIVHASSAACAGRHLPAQDLLLRLAASWKGALVTALYATLLSVGYTALSVSLIAVPVLNTIAVAGGGPAPRLAVVAAAGVAAAARLLYMYLSMVWAVGVVMSVLEDGSGLDALHRAEELVRGRRTQGFLVAAALTLGGAVVAGSGGGRGGGRTWKDAFACAAHLLLGMFSPMVYTVFYHECKRSSHGDGAVPEPPHHTKADRDRGASMEGVV